MNGRRYIKNSITLRGESDGAYFDRTFRIVKVISEGADGVCYQAYHEKSGIGVLKEFYPKAAIGAERNDKGQLGHTSQMGSSLRLFREAREEFLRPYEMLLDIRQRDPGSDIATFIPAFEIYRGSSDDEDFDSTVYIWTPEPQMVTFDRICDEIHRHPAVRPEHKLLQILTAIENLTRCICALHSADIIHRDIKPSNFGFLSRGGEPLMQSISLFDIDSLCSVWAENIDVRGTTGYMEPEAVYGEVSNQTDIYSIGATLFSAVIINEQTRKDRFLYRDSYYHDLRNMVDTSELITASEANSHPRLRAALTTILRRSLCGRAARYESCEELLDDIHEAMYYALPYDSEGRKRSAGERWVLASDRGSSDAYADKNSYLQILYHLYDEPLYSRMKSGESVLNVAVVGFDICAQRFLDACLQTAQMPGAYLDVDVYYSDPVDRDLYLEERPELRRFFKVMAGKYVSPEGEPYGDIHFIRAGSAGGGKRNDEAAIVTAACGNAGKKAYHYAFISIDEDEVNREAAEAVKAADMSGECPVSFVCRGISAGGSPDADIKAVRLSGERRKDEASEELERMAFNTHLIWEKYLDRDHLMVRKAFRSPYNHEACVAGVISLKYKLHGIGIELGEGSYGDAADRYAQLMESDGSAAIRNGLMWAEHRRWVTEKICLGWTQLKDLEVCALRGTKNEKTKQHACIVQSRPDQMLADITGGADPYEVWGSLTDEQVACLDDLDKLTVLLHREYVKKASEVTCGSVHGDRLLNMIRSSCEGYPSLMSAFREWHRCVEDMWNGDRQAARRYEGLKGAMLQAASETGADTEKLLRQQTGTFDGYFRPVYGSLMCRDWKQVDADIIDGIPFILTYSARDILVIPFTQGDSAGDMFRNLAAATVTGPAGIIYLYRADSKAELEKLPDEAERICLYLQRRKMKAYAEFIIIEGNASVSNGMTRDIVSSGRGRIKNVNIIRSEESRRWEDILLNHLRKRSRGRNIAIEMNGSGLSAELKEHGIPDDFDCFSFDPSTGIFTSGDKRCHYNYITKEPRLLADDVAVLCGPEDIVTERPEYYSGIDVLMNRYSEDPEAWIGLCSALRKHSEKADRLAVFRPSGADDVRQTVSFRIPSACGRPAAKILEGLKRAGVAGEESRVVRDTSDSCFVSSSVKEEDKGRLEKLFADIYALTDPDVVMVGPSADGSSAEVRADGLMVSDLRADAADEAAMMLLKKLSADGCLIAYTEEGGSVSFAYSSGYIKRLLTEPARMAGLMEYLSARRSGCCDDAALVSVSDGSGTEETEAKLCLLTRGLTCSVIVCTDAAKQQASIDKLIKTAEKLTVNGEIKVRR